MFAVLCTAFLATWNLSDCHLSLTLGMWKKSPALVALASSRATREENDEEGDEEGEEAGVALHGRGV